MGMDIDEARCHQQALRVYLLGATPAHLPNGDDAPAGDGHVRFARCTAGAVHHGAAANYQVGLHPHRSFPPFPPL